MNYILDDDVLAFIKRCDDYYGDGSARLEIAQQRRNYRDLCRSFDVPHPGSLSVRDNKIPGPAGPIPIRIYRPDRPEGTQTTGCLVYYHGGGWIMGDLDSHDTIAAEIAARAGVVVIAIDYRLAPEHTYPAGHDDSWAALDYIADNAGEFNIDASKIAVGGDSAGGNLAASVALRASDQGGPELAGQILLYSALGGNDTLQSYDECHDAPMLSTVDMHIFHEFYFGSRDLPDDPMACPLKAQSQEGLPPAFLQAAQYDPLRDDTVEYACRLDAAGVAVELHVETGLVHGFLRARHVTRRGGEAFDRTCRAVRRLIGPA